MTDDNFFPEEPESLIHTIWELNQSGTDREEFERMIKQGSLDLNTTKEGRTLLMDVMLSRHWWLFDLLLECGADVNIQNPYGNTVLTFLLDSNDYWNMYDNARLAQLLRFGADPAIPFQDGYTALHLALHNLSYNREVIELLLKYGADPNAKNDAGETPIQFALERADRDSISPDIIKLLVKYGGHCEEWLRQEGFSLIHHLIPFSWKGPSERLIHAVQKGWVKLDTRRMGRTALMDQAIDDCNLDIMTLLLENGADVNARDSHGMTALQLLVGHSGCSTLEVETLHEALHLLVSHGANLSFHFCDFEKLVFSQWRTGRKVFRARYQAVKDLIHFYRKRERELRELNALASKVPLPNSNSRRRM